MAKIEIYTTQSCPFCIKAKSLLEEKEAGYEEIRVDKIQEKMAEAVERSGGKRTVPQIFIDNQHVGGYDELNALEKQGMLDHMLGRT